jgi:hypothetical protein
MIELIARSAGENLRMREPERKHIVKIMCRADGIGKRVVELPGLDQRAFYHRRDIVQLI